MFVNEKATSAWGTYIWKRGPLCNRPNHAVGKSVESAQASAHNGTRYAVEYDGRSHVAFAFDGQVYSNVTNATSRTLDFGHERGPAQCHYSFPNLLHEANVKSLNKFSIAVVLWAETKLCARMNSTTHRSRAMLAKNVGIMAQGGEKDSSTHETPCLSSTAPLAWRHSITLAVATELPRSGRRGAETQPLKTQ